MNCRRTKSKYDGKIAGLYDLEESIGKGHYAVVKVARHVFTGEKVAVKVIDKSRLDEISRAHLFQEVRCMKLVQHPNVVRLYEVIDTQTKLYLILELGDGGDLYDYIMKQQNGLSEPEASFYFAQIVDAISYCHQLHVVHRDLKPENVIFFKSNKVKVTDFGFSNCFTPGRKLDTSCGSLAYSAPEILLGDAYDAPAVDVWSLGVILYMLVSGKPPFQEANDSETLIRIMDCHYTTPEHVSPLFIELLRGMLRREPTERMSMSSVSQHPWLNMCHIPRHPPTPLVTLGSVSGQISNKSKTSALLVNAGTLTDDEHSYILQKMIEGKIASRDEILRCLECNAYNHVTATYYLLAERLLRKRNALAVSSYSQQTNGQLPARSSLGSTGRPRAAVSNGQCATDESHSTSNSVPPSSSVSNRGSSSPGSSTDKKCLIIEELCEDEIDECTAANSNEEEFPQSTSAGKVTASKEQMTLPKSVSSVPCGNSHVSDPGSPGKQGANRSLHAVNSLPQLVLNQISEEDEDDECHHHVSDSVTAACLKQESVKVKHDSVSTDKVHDVSLVRQPGRQTDSNVAGTASSSPVSALLDGKTQLSVRHLHNIVAFEVNDVDAVDDDDDDDDISVLGGHHGMRRELFRQSSLLQTSHTDCESLAVLPYTGTTNSLDRRLFHQQKKLTKSPSATSRSIVGAVKKSVSMILGHFAAVGDIPSVKPSTVDTWGSCGNLSQQGTTKKMVDRHRATDCQLARELRQNRSEHDASTVDTNKARSSSNVIRVRSRDFSTLMSKFAAGSST